jgi:hypothetical protein
MRTLFNERFLLRFTQVLTGFALLCLFLGTAWTLLRPSEIAVHLPPQQDIKALQNAFLQKRESYEKIGPPWLALKEAPPPLLLPDLKTILTYHGMNGRPDSPQERPVLHMGLQGSKEVTLVSQGERFYVDYKRIREGEESFNLTREERPLWIEVEPHDQEAHVKVGLNLEGHPALEPQILRLNLKELARLPFGGQGWEIGKLRADGTLLARQQAKWVGPDCFLERHGGDEFAHLMGKHRIDFGEGEEIYSVFVGLSDCLGFYDNRWHPTMPGEETKNLPLLQVKRIDERIMALDLWDPTGQKKVPLTLIKAQEPWAKEALQKEFRFVGAKTRTQCVFEIGHERHLLKPQDWLVQTEEGWQKLETDEEIDDYVERRISGPLFVFDGYVKEEDHQVLMGTLFNNNRTDSFPIHLAIQRGGVTIVPAEEQIASVDSDDDPFIEVVAGGGRTK